MELAVVAVAEQEEEHSPWLLLLHRALTTQGVAVVVALLATQEETQKVETAALASWSFVILRILELRLQQRDLHRRTSQETGGCMCGHRLDQLRFKVNYA
jgi:hypothetical protein